MNRRTETRTVAAWIAAVIAFFAITAIASRTGDALRVPTSIYVGLHTVHFGAGAETETDTASTSYGLGTMLLSVLGAVAAWHLTAGQRFSPEARAHFLGWLTGAVIVTVGGVVLWKVLGPGRGSGGFALSNICNVILVAGAAFVGTQLTKRLVQKAELTKPHS